MGCRVQSALRCLCLILDWTQGLVVMRRSTLIFSVLTPRLPSSPPIFRPLQDRTIKIWDMASGQLKLTLTGHIEQVTGLAVSARHPYMFSVGLDKMVKCWDLERNQVRGCPWGMGGRVG